MDSLEIKIERFPECSAGIEKLSALHYKEISAFVGKLECAPDFATYAEMCKRGVLQITTVRDMLEGFALVGYCVDIVSPSLHYSKDLFAVNDVVYLLPNYRKAAVGYELIRTAREALKARGVSVHLLHMKEEHKFDKTAERLGYGLLDLVYCNMLQEEK